MRIGYVDRCFPDNWRPALDEVAFAAAHQFGALQYMVHPFVTARPEQTDVDWVALRAALEAADIAPTLEINCRVNADGLLEDGRSPIAWLEKCLPFIQAVACPHVHVHFTADALPDAAIARVEEQLIPYLEWGVAWGAEYGFPFAFEHNAPGLRHGQLFTDPATCARVLERVPDLGFVWDFNHTRPEHQGGFIALAPRVTLAHVSDTPLPEVNHHLPLGMGKVDFARYCAALKAADFGGVLIMEIGGLPISGGFGRDTNEALRDSQARLAACL